MPTGRGGRETFHRRHRGAGAFARRGRALDLDRRDTVVAFEPRRAVSPQGSAETRHGNHLARVVAHVPAAHVLGQHAVRGIGLQINLLDPSPFDEVVDISRSPGGGQRGIDVRKRQAQRLGLLAVDLDAELRGVVQPVRPDHGQVRVLGRHAEQLIAGRHQFFRVPNRPGPSARSRNRSTCRVR